MQSVVLHTHLALTGTHYVIFDIVIVCGGVCRHTVAGFRV